jgi:hypothetical protein
MLARQSCAEPAVADRVGHVIAHAKPAWVLQLHFV